MAKKKISKKKAAEELAKAIKKRVEEPDVREEPGPHSAVYRFRRNLRALREEAGHSQAQLGLAMGISGVHVCLIENGRRLPSIEMLDRFAEFFKVDPTEMIKEIK